MMMLFISAMCSPQYMLHETQTHTYMYWFNIVVYVSSVGKEVIAERELAKDNTIVSIRASVEELKRNRV